MKFSVFTVSLPEWDPQQAVSELVAAGYDGVEWRVVDDTGVGGGFWSGNKATVALTGIADAIGPIAELSRSAGLELPSLGSYVSCEEPAEVETVMRAASSVGVPQLRVRVPGYDGSQSYRSLWDRARAQYADIAGLAARHGVKALIEIHQNTIVSNPHAAASFVADFDPAAVGVLHDIGNMVVEGWCEYRASLEVLGVHLAHVHLKSARWEPDGTRPDGSVRWCTPWAPLRSGIVDVPRFFQALAQVGYDGWLSFEDFSTEAPLRERVVDNLRYASQFVRS